MTRRRVLLVNPNTSARITQILADEARRLVGENAEIVAVTAPFGASALECRAELVIAAHAVLETIAANRDCDAVVIGAFGDPGLEAARDIARGAVFGLGQSGLRAAGAGGRRFAIVTVGARLRGEIERMVAACGLSHQLSAIRFLEGGVLDIAADRARFCDAMAAAAAACATEDGAEAVLFGGAPFAGVGRELAGRAIVPLVDGLTSAIADAVDAMSNLDPAYVRAGRAKAISGVSRALADSISEFLARDSGRAQR